MCALEERPPRETLRDRSLEWLAQNRHDSVRSNGWHPPCWVASLHFSSRLVALVAFFRGGRVHCDNIKTKFTHPASDKTLILEKGVVHVPWVYRTCLHVDHMRKLRSRWNVGFKSVPGKALICQTGRLEVGRYGGCRTCCCGSGIRNGTCSRTQ